MGLFLFWLDYFIRCFWRIRDYAEILDRLGSYSLLELDFWCSDCIFVRTYRITFLTWFDLEWTVAALQASVSTLEREVTVVEQMMGSFDSCVDIVQSDMTELKDMMRLMMEKVITLGECFSFAEDTRPRGLCP